MRCLQVMWSGVQSVVLAVEDFEVGLADVARLLGHEPAWLGTTSERESAMDGGFRTALFALSNTLLEVREVARPARAQTAAGLPRVSADGPGEGLIGIRLGAEDLARAADWLAGRGLPPSAGRSEQAAGVGGAPDRRWSIRALDPTASRSIGIELIQEQGGWPSAGDACLGAGHGSVDALDHIVILSADLEESRALYGERLGIRLALDRSFAARGIRLLFFRLGGVTIEIGGRLGAEPRPQEPDRFGGLAWRVSDVAQARARLVAEGFDVSPVRDGHKAGTRVCTVRDPVHNVPTLLIQPAA